jgi:hypothetical protein
MAKQVYEISATSVAMDGNLAMFFSGVPADSGVAVDDLLDNPMEGVGDMIVGGADGAPTRLAAGTDDYVLTMNSGIPAWEPASGGGGTPGGSSGDMQYNDDGSFGGMDWTYDPSTGVSAGSDLTMVSGDIDLGANALYLDGKSGAGGVIITDYTGGLDFYGWNAGSPIQITTDGALLLQGNNIAMANGGGMGGGTQFMDGGIIAFPGLNGDYGDYSYGSSIQTGSFNNDTGGDGGIGIVCGVGYEFNWQGGHMASTYDAGETFSAFIVDSDFSMNETDIWIDSEHAIHYNGYGDDNWQTGIIGFLNTTTIGKTTSLQTIVGAGEDGPDGYAIGNSDDEDQAWFEVRGYDGLISMYGSALSMGPDTPIEFSTTATITGDGDSGINFTDRFGALVQIDSDNNGLSVGMTTWFEDDVYLNANTLLPDGSSYWSTDGSGNWSFAATSVNFSGAPVTIPNLRTDELSGTGDNVPYLSYGDAGDNGELQIGDFDGAYTGVTITLMQETNSVNIANASLNMAGASVNFDPYSHIQSDGSEGLVASTASGLVTLENSSGTSATAILYLDESGDFFIASDTAAMTVQAATNLNLSADDLVATTLSGNTTLATTSDYSLEIAIDPGSGNTTVTGDGDMTIVSYNVLVQPVSGGSGVEFYPADGATNIQMNGGQFSLDSYSSVQTDGEQGVVISTTSGNCALEKGDGGNTYLYFNSIDGNFIIALGALFLESNDGNPVQISDSSTDAVWSEFGDYTAGTVVPTGYITLTVNGRPCQLLTT